MVKLKLVEEEDGELVDKGPEIIKGLAEKLSSLSPQAQEVYDLLKAKVQKEKQLKYPALQKLAETGKALYEKQMAAMLKEVNKVLDQAGKVQKSEDSDDLEKAEETIEVHRPTSQHLKILDNKEPKINKGAAGYLSLTNEQYACVTCAHWVPGGPEGKSSAPDTCVKHGPSVSVNSNGRCKAWTQGEPVPARPSTGNLTKETSRYHENQYHTGFKCNRCQYYEKGGDCRIVEAKSAPDVGTISPIATCIEWRVAHNTKIPIETQADLQKSQDLAFLMEHEDLSHLTGDRVQKAKKKDPYNPNIDHTKKIADKDQQQYLAVRQQLLVRGYKNSDFDNAAGRLYGWSTNALIEHVRKHDQKS